MIRRFFADCFEGAKGFYREHPRFLLVWFVTAVLLHGVPLGFVLTLGSALAIAVLYDQIELERRLRAKHGENLATWFRRAYRTGYRQAQKDVAEAALRRREEERGQ